MYFRSLWFPSKIPFTLAILPVFWLGLLLSPNLNQWKALIVLITVHVFLYGAVNGLVNFFDKQNKREATSNLTYAKLSFLISITLLLIAIAFAAVRVSFTFATLILSYALISWLWVKFVTKLSIRPVITYGVPSIAQGLFTLIMYYIGLSGFDIARAIKIEIILPGIAISILILVFHLYTREKESKELNAAKRVDTDHQQLIYLSPLLLLGAQTLLIWYFNKYISTAYNLGLSIVSVISFFVLFQNYYRDNKSHVLHWLNWIMIVILNGYSFYLFGNHTNVFQLLH